MRRILIASLLLCAPAYAAPLDEARVLIDEGSYEEARTILERSVEDPALESHALILLTRLNNDLEDYESGIRYGKQSVKLAPDNAQAHFQYAVALRTKMSKVSKVRAMFSIGAYKKELRAALDLAPDDPDARNEEIGFLVTAPGAVGGDLDLAWERALELEKLDWRHGLRWQSEIQFMKKQDEAGVATLHEMLERDPSGSGTRFRLAYWYQSHERYEEADHEFEILQADDVPRISMNALYQRARTRVLGGYEQERAVEILQTFLETLPDEPAGIPGRESAYWRMGNAYEQLGRNDDARRAYERSLSIKETDSARKSLKSLGKTR
jgi:tetratricopeptide (TPR) repeat protein